jgi:hypothetical protein
VARWLLPALAGSSDSMLIVESELALRRRREDAESRMWESCWEEDGAWGVRDKYG